MVCVLVEHYGFTEEEMGRFETCPYNIINYDIKYRMGRESLEEGEE